MSRLPALLVRHPPLAEIASGYRQRHAGDIAGLIAGEKQDRIRLFRQRAVSVKRILSPYAAALWLAINFSYQNPAGVIPRSRNAVATALTIGGGPQR